MVRLEIHQGSTRSDVTGVISQSVSKAVIELGGLRPGLFNPGAVGPGSSLSGSCGTGSLDFSFFIFIRCIVDAYIAGGPFDFKKRTGTAKAQVDGLKRRVAPAVGGGADDRRVVVVPATAANDAVCTCRTEGR